MNKIDKIRMENWKYMSGVKTTFYTSIYTVFYLLLIEFIHFMHLIIYLRILMHEL